jgi:serine/threonine-protein kinase
MPVKIGERFRGRWEVVEHVGEGAFAHVYRARDSDGQAVALKVLKDPFLGVKEVVERFQREVFAVASITSPHVVRLHDFGFSDEEFFLVTEFVSGPTLRALMGRAWTSADIHTIVGQVAHALAEAHRHEIVHRDLKPENVMLVESAGGWQAKVLDFGLAKLPELERKLDLAPITRAGQLFGTPQYLSPEQIRGRSVDGGADLFALGVITYEMLAGHRPWEGDNPHEVMLAVLHNPAPPITNLSPELQPRAEDLGRFLDRALAKPRDERFGDATRLFAELSAALYGANVPLPEVSSKSIAIKLNPRADATLVNETEGDQTRKVETGRDTTKQPAMHERFDQGSDVPIFVSEGGSQMRSLDSGWQNVIDEREDSQKKTIPQGVRVVPAVPRAPAVAPRRSAWRSVLAILVLATVAAVAFWLGRTLR